MIVKNKKKFTHDEIIMIFYALRYSFGRETIASSVPAEYIIKNKEKISKEWCNQIIRETEEAIDLFSKIKGKDHYTLDHLKNLVEKLKS